MVGWYSACCTRTVRVTLTYADTLIRGRVDGIPCIVHVLSEFRDTLTRGGEGGRVVIHVLYTLCQSYSGVHGGQLNMVLLDMDELAVHFYAFFGAERA